MQYFKDRSHAGRELAKRLERYRDSMSVVMTLSLGGVVVATEVARQLRVPMGMLAVEEISLPWRDAPVVGSIDQSGEYLINQEINESVMNSYVGEFHSHIDQEKIRAQHEINLMHASSTLKRDHLRDHNIIIVSDGLKEKGPVREALAYLKPVKTTRIICAVPIATVDVIDYLHMSVDEIHCLDVKENYLDTDHYYDDPRIPEYDELFKDLVSFDTMA